MSMFANKKQMKKSMVKHISKKKIKIDLCQLKRLGIDEIALKRSRTIHRRLGQPGYK